MRRMDADLERQIREETPTASEAQDLVELADEIAALPRVAPRRAWLHESKWRLLRKFDELQADRPESPDNSGANG